MMRELQHSQRGQVNSRKSCKRDASARIADVGGHFLLKVAAEAWKGSVSGRFLVLTSPRPPSQLSCPPTKHRLSFNSAFSSCYHHLPSLALSRFQISIMGSTHSPESLRILCLGDSLTEGYTMSGVSFAPYSETLEKRLKESGRHVTVVTDGISGDLVTMGSFRRRMERRCKSFDMVIRAVFNKSFGNLALVFSFLFFSLFVSSFIPS
jgi:hypothetical protein